MDSFNDVTTVPTKRRFNTPFPKVSLATLCRAEPDALMEALHSFSTPDKATAF